MKKLYVLCIALLLALSACGQGSSEATMATQPPAETTQEAQETTLEPDGRFEAFYEDFKAAVHNRDMRFIDSILDEGITSSFGGDPGKDYFHEHWDNEKKYHGRDLWAVLEEIIALGGVHYQAGEYSREISGECFVAPRTYVDNEGADFDPGNYRLCIEQKDGGWKLLWLVSGD